MNITLDSKEFDTAINLLIASGKKTASEEVNQRAMNVAVRAFKNLPPKEVTQARREVKAYMDFNPVLRYRTIKTGKNKGKKKLVRKKSQLTRKNLIAQAQRAKAGLKGLYGDAMRIASGKVSRIAQTSQGYVKSVFIPIIIGLYPYVKFRPPVSLTRQIARWPGSSGSGRVTPAKDGTKAFALLQTSLRVDPGQDSKVRTLQYNALANAMSDETREMKKHYQDRIAKMLNLVRPKK